MARNLYKLILGAVVIAGVSIAGTYFYIDKIKTPKETILSPQEAAQKAVDYINQNKTMFNLEGQTVSLVSVAEENGIYKFRLKIGESEYDSFVTKNGKFLFTSGINLEENAETSNGQSEKKTCEDIKKTDGPHLEAFVVSQCPFGLQMQRILNEIVKNMPSLADNIKVEYIGSVQDNKITSMHGEEEAQENLRQICLREEQPDKYWNYIDCHIQKGDVDGCLTTANADKTKLNTCMTDTEKGLEYAKADFDSQDKYQVSSSPTLFLDGEEVSEFDFGGRTVEAVKTLLCCGFKTTPEACSQKLVETQAATGFSETYGQSSDSSGGSCE